jgi:hypothetical protein
MTTLPPHIANAETPMNPPNLDRFQPPGPSDEPRFTDEEWEEIELDKADAKMDAEREER